MSELTESRELVGVDLTYDHIEDVYTIAGIRYAGALFHRLGGAFELNQPFEIVSRGDGALTLRRVEGSMRHVGVVNLARCLRWHAAGLNSWSLSDWAVALAGEVGELCDAVKKLNRARDGLVGNKLSPEELRLALQKEAADVYLYLDLFAQAAGFDLSTAVREKFNEVSERNGFPERL